MPDKKLFTAAGAPVVDNTNVMTAGEYGPVLLQDVWLLEKLAHFDREVIPERRMHAKGSAAYGTFTVTQDLTAFTRAKLFAEVGKKTEVFVRFSTVAGERGAADAERDIRGFAIKFYTEEGNWDLVGNNTPVFYLRDPLRFPDLNHVVKRDPQTNLRNLTYKWDFFSQLPEALHQLMIDFSDRGLPLSYRYMHGFGSHTFSFLNDQQQRFWVKFHFRSQQGIKNLMDDEAATLIGQDRESSQRDLYNAIAQGAFPSWKLFVQVLSDEQLLDLDYNPFDLTKVWLHEDAPLRELGILELNRNPENYFSEVEQAAFNPANIVPGIGFSPDKMLQGRLFSYGDAQRYRLGVNHHQIPVNAPRCPFHQYHRDGAMRVDGNSSNSVTYTPNSFGYYAEQNQIKDLGLCLEGEATHWDHRTDDTYYTQPRALYGLFSNEEKQRVMIRIARELSQIPYSIRDRQLQLFAQVDTGLAQGIIEALSKLQCV